MTLTYFPRLLCLALACFFLVYLGASAIIALYSPRALRRAGTLVPYSAARFLLTLRLLPISLATIATLGLCLPSYLWFEPEGIDEQVGFACLAMATLGSAIFGAAIVRAIRVTVKSLIFARRCNRSGHQIDLSDSTALVIESTQPFLALTGIVRPRVVISQGIVNALTEEELAVVLNHESAHRSSRDNLKRLCLSLAPGLRQLERAWVRYAEYSADDQAVGGDMRQSLALASALVRVARFGRIPSPAFVATPFLGEVSELSDRVNRLLNYSPVAPSPARSSHTLARALMMAALAAVIACNASTFRFVQLMLEHLIR